MPILDKYRDYFRIDPEYFPQVNEAIINNNPDLWKKFYPHETFVKLIKDTINVISRKQKVSVWVEGAYGTGKSHAVLTLKRLLDASESDTREYFEKYKDQLSNDLLGQLQQIKGTNERILTVHRYGSSSIRNDSQLVFAIQESISNALREKGLDEFGKGALKVATIDWLSDDANKAYFNTLIKGQYLDLFSGDNVDDVITKLNSYAGDSLLELMSKIMKVAEERHFKALSLNVDGLSDWVRSVIKENNLKAIVLIWDEFTEYFRHNMRALTGFQKLADLSGSDPFYFVLVTHNVNHIFHETDNDWKKILGRFVSPICSIELPENMAFRLMGAAMEKNQDPHVLADWEETKEELYERTHESRQLVKQKAHITDKELISILPIHPYTALLLKHISSAFDSNQRSMFDFIKNDRGDEIKGFQWFVNSHGSMSNNPFLTIDMLWDFFYEKGKEYLSHDIRSILDCYSRSATKLGSNDEARVLKTTLLLQAISHKVGNAVELFVPNEKNLNLAFEGSDLENDEPSRLANKLERDQILYKKQVGGKAHFSALTSTSDSSAVEKFREEIRKKSTSALVVEGDLSSAIALSGALKLRYLMKNASANDFKANVNSMRGLEGTIGNRIMALTTFSKEENESALIAKQIRDALQDGSYNMVFIDSSSTPLGNDLFEQYVDAMAHAMYLRGKDNSQANQYEAHAKTALKKWRDRIANGEFIIHTVDIPQGLRVNNVDQLYNVLLNINKKKFKHGLETVGSVTETMWMSNSLAAGVECGASENTSGQYKSANPQSKLENYIGVEAWQKSNYWNEKPYLPISQIKKCVEDTIKTSFVNEGRVSMSAIYEALESEPYGIMPCNLSAFVLGFVLKDYASDTYTWSDGLASDIMSLAKLKEMVSEVIKHKIAPIPRYKDKYIVTLTESQRAFNSAASQIFNISSSRCTSIEQTRELIRQKMKEFSFPIWCIKSILDMAILKNEKQKVSELIDLFYGIANSNNLAVVKTDSDIALSIGKICIENEGIIDDLKSIVTKEKCVEGMKAFLNSFESGTLINLSTEIGDGGQYINCVRKKFDAVDAANWVWNVDTAQQKIKEVILEYKIIVESNKVLPKNTTFDGVMNEWSDKCKFIRISYLYAKNSWGELSDFMSVLFGIKKSGNLIESEREKFLVLIKNQGSTFDQFYKNQMSVFKETCGFFLEKYQLSEDEITEVFKNIPADQFIREKADYQNTIQETIEKHLADSLGKQLKDIWKSRTNTESPYEWSRVHKMPVLCMIPDKDFQKAREAFNTINKKNADNGSIEKAIAYLNSVDYISDFDSEERRNAIFRSRVIKNFDILLDDIDEVKDHLSKVISVSSYDWFGLPEVDKKLGQMAEIKYNKIGCNKALERIDNMESADVKRYLKELIKDNMIVGMEIIRNN